jgi:RNase P subunit RPR2
MADFCRDCAAHLWGDPNMTDLAGLTTEEQTKQGIYAVALCEGCGETVFVDHTGQRVNGDSPYKEA